MREYADYLTPCCSCEKVILPEWEAPRGVCLKCNKEMCGSCVTDSRMNWKGLCFFCSPDRGQDRSDDPTIDPKPYEPFLTRSEAERKNRARENSAKHKAAQLQKTAQRKEAKSG